jgi:hypothetical protein
MRDLMSDEHLLVVALDSAAVRRAGGLLNGPFGNWCNHLMFYCRLCDLVISQKRVRLHVRRKIKDGFWLMASFRT